jgi:sugar phosphate isomerase/epimerase
LKKYPGRFTLLHLKDLRKGVATGPTNGKGNVEDNVPLGEGQANVAAVVAAARVHGARWFFLEDESSRALEQLPESLAFLRGL